MKTSIETLGRAPIGLAHSNIRESRFNGGAKSHMSSKVCKSLNASSVKAMASITRIGLKVGSSSNFCSAGFLSLLSKRISLVALVYMLDPTYSMSCALPRQTPVSA